MSPENHYVNISNMSFPSKEHRLMIKVDSDGDVWCTCSIPGISSQYLTATIKEIMTFRHIFQKTENGCNISYDE